MSGSGADVRHGNKKEADEGKDDTGALLEVYAGILRSQSICRELSLLVRLQIS